ncbi:MAG: menaquinone biosynthetic enzyme MqnA/MqnD family protein [Pyrinomonadaceae bacterium]
MNITRISASSYSNTAPLIWSFLYGSRRADTEVILDTAPARSAAFLLEGRVDAALVPVIASHEIRGVRILPDVCVGANERVQSVCLITRGCELKEAKSVALDISSRTSYALTKIIFNEFFGFEPKWNPSKPNIEAMLAENNCALLIGDPALAIEITHPELRKFDLVEVWRSFTGFGFVFAMWMTKLATCSVNFAGARDEGLAHVDEIIANYTPEIPLTKAAFKTYLTESISYTVNDSMKAGMELYFVLAKKHGII